MRKPNGYGAVIKLQGNRRKPYAVRITTGWDYNAKQKYKYLGYYRTVKEAEIALADYNKNPYVLKEDITFEELYERYSRAKYKNLSDKTVGVYAVAFNTCKALHNLSITKLNLGLLQDFVDTSNKNKPMLKQIKVLWTNMFDYAIKNEWLPPERKAIISNVDINKGNPNQQTKLPFSHEEIELLWKHTEDYRVRYVLVLIYTGVRVGELLSLSPDDIHEDYFDITKSKTKAGIRQVPIADKIKSFDLVCNHDYPSFLRNIWKPCMKDYSLNHTPHEARHTCISLLSEKEVDQRVIKAIVGHTGSGVTEQVYTHFPLKKLLEAINTI